MVIVAGDYSLTIFEGTEQEIIPHLLVPHPEYNMVTNNHDIMLIKVQYCKLRFSFHDWISFSPTLSGFFWSHCPTSFQLRVPIYLNSYVSIALLPRQGASIAEGRMCRVSGWGYTNPSGGQIPSTLRTVKLPIVSSQKCNRTESFDGSITENMLCAGYSFGGKDACKVSGSLSTQRSCNSQTQCFFISQQIPLNNDSQHYPSPRLISFRLPYVVSDSQTKALWFLPF